MSARFNLIHLVLLFSLMGGVQVATGYAKQPTPGSTLETQQEEVTRVVQRVLPGVVTVRQDPVAIDSSGIIKPNIVTKRPLISSGFVIDPNGYIVCSADGVSGPGPYKIILQDGMMVTARKVGVDKLTNIALLQLDFPQQLTALSFGDSEAVPLGATAILIGNRAGLSGSVTVGTIGGKDRVGRTSDKRLLLLLQFNAPVQAGEVGAPLLNIRGEVIGVLAGSLQVEGVPTQLPSTGFAIPSNIVKRVVSELQTSGKARHPWLGVAYETLTTVINNLTPNPGGAGNYPPVTNGVILRDVRPNSPAAKAGLQVGDIVTQVGDTPIPNLAAMTKVLFNSRPDQTLKLRVIREGEPGPITIQVKLGTQILDR